MLDVTLCFYKYILFNFYCNFNINKMFCDVIRSYLRKLSKDSKLIIFYSECLFYVINYNYYSILIIII